MTCALCYFRPGSSHAHRDADTSSTRQRIIFLLSLTALVTFFAPIQFAFLMLTLMHLFTTVSSLVTAQTSPVRSLAIH